MKEKTVRYRRMEDDKVFRIVEKWNYPEDKYSYTEDLIHIEGKKCTQI